MIEQIIPINLPLPIKLSSVNCYLVRTSDGFFLVDTGMTNARRQLESALVHFCTQPGDLKLILITHGDFDHTGNARYLRDKFGSRIAMHTDDAPMLEKGDMLWKRKVKSKLLMKLMPMVIRLGESNQCAPDVLLSDGDSLADFGLDAQILNTPGHSSGSICLLTSSGDLFCGDLLTNSSGTPRLNSMMYDQPAGDASLARLKNQSIKMVYPGHGKPFPWESLVNRSNQ
jgi:hydroxyacylglutathione hydrolase